MKFTVITLFPEVFASIIHSSILKRACQKGLVEFNIVNLRKFAKDPHHQVDDRPYGGGVGMILKADVLTKAVREVTGLRLRGRLHSRRVPKVILMSASGKPYTQKKAYDLSKMDHIILICGHYEGVDQRFIDNYVDGEISIGDYVLTGGEIPAMVIIDSVTRLIPKVLEKKEATKEESFSTFNSLSSTIQFLEYPQYTRPEEFEGKKVPKILLSGNHQEIAKWRKEAAIKKTKKIRPDLLKG